MSKYKLITILSCGLLITGAIAGKSLVTNIPKTSNNKVIESHILLSAPNLTNLAVVINTNKNPLVLYSKENSNSNIESYISVGEMLNYTSTNNPNFYKITVQETGASGYIAADNMQIIESGLNKAYTNIDKNGQVINVTYDVKLMSSPDVHAQILGSYKNDTHLTILGKQDQWYKVNIGRQTGYMYQSYVGIDSTSANIKTTDATSNTNISTTKTVNNNIASTNAHKQFTISEKMVTQAGDIVVPEKVIYKGDNYNPENIKTMVLPKGYDFGKLNVYNNGVMVETGGTQTNTLVGFNLNLPSIKHLKSGNLLIEYIVQKLKNPDSVSRLYMPVYTKSKNKTSIYTEPETNSPVKQIIDGHGIILELTATQKITLPNGTIYYKVITPDGNTGYVLSSDVSNKFSNHSSNYTGPITQKLDISKYSGTWTPKTKVGENEAFAKQPNMTKTQLNDNKIVMTKDLYSYKNKTIKNPTYYLVTYSNANVFGNMANGGYSITGLNTAGTINLIIPVAKGQNIKDLVHPMPNLEGYPVIIDNTVTGFIGTANQVYTYQLV